MQANSEQKLRAVLRGTHSKIERCHWRHDDSAVRPACRHDLPGQSRARRDLRRAIIVFGEPKDLWKLRGRVDLCLQRIREPGESQSEATDSEHDGYEPEQQR